MNAQKDLEKYNTIIETLHQEGYLAEKVFTLSKAESDALRGIYVDRRMAEMHAKHLESLKKTTERLHREKEVKQAAAARIQNSLTAAQKQVSDLQKKLAAALLDKEQNF